MDVAKRKRSEYHARRRVFRLINAIALILIVAMALGLLVSATLALVGLDRPNAYPQ
jgi:hypothetical protein